MEETKKMKRVILIGPSMAGKTTLCQYISHEDLNYNKTQTVEVVNGTMIDTPGEYLERRHMRGALIVTAADADLIILVQPVRMAMNMFPPGYSSSFAKPCIGVVTKADLGDAGQIREAWRYLKAAGARRVFVTSSYEGTGFGEFLDYLKSEQ